MEELEFIPHSPWQQLRTGKSYVVALHFPQDFNPPSHDIITAAAIGCQEHGYSLNLIASSISESELLAIYRSGQADGMILMEILTHDWRVERLRQAAIPFVMIGRCMDNSGLSYVDVDIANGVIAAMRHLYSLGHRQILFVTMAPVRGDKEYSFTKWAIEGYRQVCQELGLEEHRAAADGNGQSVEEVTLRALQERPVTAIVTPQNATVPGILRAIEARGWRIPSDVSVIGLVDESTAGFTLPSLTAIDFPSTALGRRAAEILIRQLEGDADEPEQILLPAELRIRGSTAPPAA